MVGSTPHPITVATKALSIEIPILSKLQCHPGGFPSQHLGARRGGRSNFGGLGGCRCVENPTSSGPEKAHQWHPIARAPVPVTTGHVAVYLGCKRWSKTQQAETKRNTHTQTYS